MKEFTQKSRRTVALVGVVLLLFVAASSALTASKVLRPSRDALEQVQVAATANDPDAQVQLAIAYRDGNNGLPKDPSQSVHWLRKSSEQGSPRAKNLLGVAYELGNGVTQNNADAFALYEEAAKSGYAEAQGNAGRMLQFGRGVTQNVALAIEWYEKAANQGHAESAHNLGTIYAEGANVPQDYEKAVRWFKKAAEEQNYGPSQANLARLLFEGHGVDQNFTQAGRYYRAALANGQENAGEFLEAARRRCLQASREITDVAARDCLVAAGSGDAGAQYITGTLYDSGTYVEQNRSEAMEWYARAALQGEPKSQMMLVVRYDDGTPENLIRSYAWALVLEKNDQAHKDEALKPFFNGLSAVKQKHEQRLTPEEMKQARELASTFRAEDSNQNEFIETIREGDAK